MSALTVRFCVVFVCVCAARTLHGWLLAGTEPAGWLTTRDGHVRVYRALATPPLAGLIVCPLALGAVVGVVACIGAMRGIINNSINYSLFADI